MSVLQKITSVFSSNNRCDRPNTLTASAFFDGSQMPVVGRAFILQNPRAPAYSKASGSSKKSSAICKALMC
jgi:hypothetical protein